MNKPDSLTNAQWQLISYAYRYGDGGVKNRINVYAVHNKTLTILHDKGLIAVGLYIRDEKERKEREEKQDFSLQSAKSALNKGDWKTALFFLRVVETNEELLKKESWWITEVAIKLIENHQQG